MKRVTNAECADMHLAYGAANGNSIEAVRIYVARYPSRHVPAHQTFVPIHRRLCTDGVFRRAQLEGRRSRRLRDPEMEEEMLEHFQNNQTTSTLSAARVLHISTTTVWEVLHDNGQHTFHVQRVQELNAEDHPRRVQ